MGIGIVNATADQTSRFRSILYILQILVVRCEFASFGTGVLVFNLDPSADLLAVLVAPGMWAQRVLGVPRRR